MIQIIFNGEPKQIEPQTLSNFLLQLDTEHSSCAIAINESFIPKSDYESTQLIEGDQLEILVPMQGG